MWRLATVVRLTRAPGPALAIVTNPANVLSITHEEDVGASIDLLRAPFHSAALQGESLEVYVSGNRHQKIDIFGIRSAGTDRAQQAHAQDAANLSGRAREGQSRSKQVCSTARVSMFTHAITDVLRRSVCPTVALTRGGRCAADSTRVLAFAAAVACSRCWAACSQLWPRASTCMPQGNDLDRASRCFDESIIQVVSDAA